MDDLLREFLTETFENIALLDTELVKFEQNPNDPELLSSIFRLVHTVKGTCGFFGLARLEHVAHASEDVLGKFRDGQLSVTPPAVSLILKSIDKIKELLEILEKTEAEPEGNDNDLIEALNALARDGAPPVVMSEPSPESKESEPQAMPEEEEDKFGFKPVRAEDTGKNMSSSTTTPASEQDKAKDSGKQSSAEDQATNNKDVSIASQTIRVSVDQLENLMVGVSELVLARNQLLQISRTQKDNPFVTPLQRLNHVTSELQEGVMKTRMQPIGNAWAKLPRLIRDLSVELKKKIDLQMVGADTELDRQVLELIKDPLTHMVRNAVDHGIESPSDRAQVGKPETGVILLNAFHEGGHIVIEISDDGRGLPVNKIRAKAQQNGLATESELSNMSDQQVMQFIFRPGFSTAVKVTEVSGRGVGMDVVKTNIEKIGGTIELQSTEGRGSRFLIKIPLTLAIVSALIVECCGERFAVPQISVVELVHASPTSEYHVEYINNTPILRLRNRLLPLVSLQQALKLQSDKTATSDTAFILILQAGNVTFGIIVDRVFDTEEIVVKPVSPILRNISMFSGNTILGDGSVVMILDPNGVATHAGQIHGEETLAAAQVAHAAQTGKGNDKQSLLLFRAGGDSPKAVPLSLVARLEEVDLKTIEYSENNPIVQYRGKLMPLVPVEKGVELRKTGSQPILVFNDQEKNMGLIVDEIIDIVEDEMNITIAAQHEGFLGSAIIAGKATDIIDTGYFLAQAFQDWFGVKDELAFGEADRQRILLVDDSPFFRNLLSPLLKVAGYDVTTAENPTEALKLQQDGIKFDAIVSDIEMPGMNGFDFASNVRQSGGIWSSLPFIALSSHATSRDMERARQAGFTDYVAKFSRESLLSTLQQTLGHSEVHQ